MATESVHPPEELFRHCATSVEVVEIELVGEACTSVDPPLSEYHGTVLALEQVIATVCAEE